MLTPASSATSSRRSPFTRRLLPPYAGRPACSGVMRARRETRNSRTCDRWSAGRRVAHAVHGRSPSAARRRYCRYPEGQALPRGTRMAFGRPDDTHEQSPAGWAPTSCTGSATPTSCRSRRAGPTGRCAPRDHLGVRSGETSACDRAYGTETPGHQRAVASGPRTIRAAPRGTRRGTSSRGTTADRGHAIDAAFHATTTATAPVPTPSSGRAARRRFASTPRD